MAFRWINSPSNAFIPMFDARVAAIKNGAYQIAQYRAIEGENWMKENAIWEDQTGNARQGLAADVIRSDDAIIILFTIGRHPDGGFLSYGKHLELAHGGTYAIVGPAVDHFAPIVMQDMKALMH